MDTLLTREELLKRLTTMNTQFQSDLATRAKKEEVTNNFKRVSEHFQKKIQDLKYNTEYQINGVREKQTKLNTEMADLIGEVNILSSQLDDKLSNKDG